MLLRLQKYDIHIVYKEGKEMYLADTLSRAYLVTGDTKPRRDEQVLQLSDVEVEVKKAQQTDFTPISKPTMTKIQQAINLDDAEP